MLEKEDLYCNLFIDFEGDLKEVDNLVAELTNGNMKSSVRVIETTFAEMDVRRNDGYKTPKELRSKDPDDDFLFWKYHIDIETIEHISRSIYISNISKLILKLWAKGIDAVAACGFEDELPKR
jgi:hypothetical protein